MIQKPSQKCLTCNKIKPLTYFHTDLNKISGYKSQCSDCCNSKKRASKHSINRRYGQYKSRAKKIKVSFKLSLKTFTALTKKPCVYCGGFSDDLDFTGIDRINSNKGYVIGNCVPCCKTCNFMKWKFDKDFFLSQIKKIFIFSMEKNK